VADKQRSARPGTGAKRKAADAVVSPDDCDPARCPCDDAACSLSRYVRTTQAANGDEDHHTLEATEQAVAERLSGLSIDMSAMAVISNVYRAANAVRNHVERTVLAPHDLTWTGWVVLWVIWIWGDIESRHVAAEAGISKGTLTGVQNTLMSRGLVKRRVHPDDARRVLLSLTPKGQKLMSSVFPEFNAVEALMSEDLDDDAKLATARALRAIVKKAENA
jgi:DNA-binding MarR family transcriptional regulator